MERGWDVREWRGEGVGFLQGDIMLNSDTYLIQNMVKYGQIKINVNLEGGERRGEGEGEGGQSPLSEHLRSEVGEEGGEGGEPS